MAERPAGTKPTGHIHLTCRPSGRSAGEDKEREGKGRDACRGSCEDGSYGNRSGVHGTDESEMIHWSSNFLIIYYGEFDSGSERTLAAWIRHASRTEWLRSLSGARVSNT